MPCRARELAAHRSLPGRVARRSKSLVAPWLAFPASSSCRGLVLRAAVPASSSCRGLAPFGRASRQAPLAGALCLVLNTLFLDGPRRDHGEFWRSPGKPCRGVLRLPVHTFGRLRYPYFSTPTLCTLVDRKRKRYINAVDVVVRLHDPTDPSTVTPAPPSSWHTFSSMTFPGLRSSKASGKSSVSTTAW